MANTKIPVELSSTPGIVDNSNATAITIDSSENVGIGITPTSKLDLLIDTDKRLTFSGGIGEIGNVAGFQSINSAGSALEPFGIRAEDIRFATGSSERMRIDSSGNVGIGTSGLPAAKLHIESAATNEAIRINTYTGYNAGINYFVNNTIKWTAQVLGDGTDAYRFYNFVSGEAMRIDSSGNLLVGKTALDNSTVGIRMNSTGDASFVKDGSRALVLNRKTSDGDIAIFLKDNSTVGSIGARAGTHLYVGSGDTGLLYQGTSDAIEPWNPSTNDPRDNAIDLGLASNRFNDIYATNGTIQTSDRNEKQDIAELSDAETRVAVAAKGLLRKFRWQSAVEEKGDEARTHFGIIAQDLQDAFTAEGLDAGDYAMFISSTWTDDDGVEQTRLGVRYSELLAFIIAAI